MIPLFLITLFLIEQFLEKCSTAHVAGCEYLDPNLLKIKKKSDAWHWTLGKQLLVVSLDFVGVVRSGPIPYDFQPSMFFLLPSKSHRLTHQRNKTSEPTNQNLPRAMAKPTFTTSILVTKMSSSLKKRFSHHSVKTSTRKHFHWEVFTLTKFWIQS